MIKSLIISLIASLVFFACEDKTLKDNLIQSKPAHKVGETKDLANDGIKDLPVIELVRIEPQSPKTGDTIRAEVIVKGVLDGIIYQWSKNGLLTGENSDTLKTELKRGDIISLLATPYKDTQKGKTVNTFTYIFNSVPVIKSTFRESTFKDNAYYYQVKAVDLDGDKLIYSLNTAPQGMEIDSLSGLIKWNINLEKMKEPKKHTVVVRVSDGYGGEAEEVFYVTTE